MPEEKVLLDRVAEWQAFSKKVEEHIKSYTIKQYQSVDGTTDQVQSWDPGKCIDAIKRYIDRFGSNARGFDDQLRDMLKTAHYASFAHGKMAANPEKYNKNKIDFSGNDIVRALDTVKMLRNSGRLSAGDKYYCKIDENIVVEIADVFEKLITEVSKRRE